MAATPITSPVVARASWSAPTLSVGPRYLQHFKCLAAECEDTCCGGWEVEISKSRHRRLKVLHSASPRERAEFKQKIALTRAVDRPKGPFAHAKIDERGRCAFLRDDSLCEIQARFGAQELPELCVIFPRHFFQIEKRLECASTLSCPEMARLCLLGEEAMSIEELPPQAAVALARPWVSLSAVSDPAVHCFEDVRLTVLEILSRTQYPLRVRLAFLLCVAEQLQPLLARMPRDGSAEIAEQVQQVLQTALRDDVLQLEAAGLAGIEATGVASAVVLRFVFDVLGEYRGERLGGMVRRIRDNYRDLLRNDDAAPAKEAASELPGQKDEQQLEELAVFEHYQSSKGAVEAQFAARIDQYFSNYCLNYVLREPYFERASLFEYLRELILQVAILRFCLFSHPAIFGDVAQFAGATRASELAAWRARLSQAELDARAVETVQRFSRDVEHSKHGLRELVRVLRELGVDGVGQTLRLAQL